MQFDWDSANISHIARHKVTPNEAEQVVENEPLDVSEVIREGESRTLHLGKTHAGRILLIIVTERNGRYRVVTARPANRKERAFYAQHKAGGNDQNPQDP